MTASTPDASALARRSGWAQTHKGKASYGSFGVGSSSHLLMAYVSESRGLGMEHVAYKGEAPMIQDMIGGVISMGLGTLGTMAPHIASGSLRPLAIRDGRGSAGRLPR
jgi:tripartite-type tricarboxylate transporter receptor subunit TctC